MTNERLKQTIKQAMVGEEKAFEQLFDSFWATSYYFCLKYLKNEQDAEDAAQEAFARMAFHIRKLRHPESFQRNLNLILAQTCQRFSSRRARQYDPERMENLHDMEATLVDEREEFLPAEILENKEMRKTLLDMVNELPKQQRQVIMLHYFHNIQQVEIADLMNTKPSNVRSLLRHARNTLAKRIDKRVKSDSVNVMVAIPILTQVLHDNIKEVTTDGLRGRIWEGVKQKEQMIESGQNLSGPVDKGRWINTAIAVAAAGFVICGLVLGFNFWQDSKQTSPVEVIARHELGDIITALKQVTDTAGFDGVVQKYAMTGERQGVTGEDVGYYMYSKSETERKVFAGYREGAAGFALAYEIVGLDAPVPDDIETWFAGNLR